MNYAELISSTSMQDRLKQLEPQEDDFSSIANELYPKTEQGTYNIYDFLSEEDFPEMNFIEKMQYWGKKEVVAIPETAKALARGLTGVSSAMGKVIYMTSDVLTPSAEMLSDLTQQKNISVEVGKSILSKIREIGLDTQEYWENINSRIPKNQIVFKDSFMKNPSFTRAMSIAAESIPLTGAALTAAIITKNPAIAYAIMGGATAADVYQEAQEAGAGRAKAFGLGAVAGTGEALIERYLGVFNKLFSKVGTKELTGKMAGKLLKEGERVAGKMAGKLLKEGERVAGKSAIKQFATKFAFDGVQEGAQEGLQQAYTNWIRKMGIDNTISLTEGIIESVIASGLSGGLIGGVTKNAEGLDAKIDELIKNNQITQNEVNTILEGTGEVLVANKEAIEPLIEQAYTENVTQPKEVAIEEQVPIQDDITLAEELGTTPELIQEARKYGSVEEFVESRKYQGETGILEESKEIEVYDQYENQYRSIEEIKDKIGELKDSLYRTYDEDLYESQEEFEEDIESDIADLEKLEDKVYQSQREASFKSIEDWLNKNNNWLGDNYSLVEDLIYRNKETQGTAWEALVQATNEEDAVEMIRRMEISNKRHEDTEYDDISKRGLTEDQVSQIRTDINRELKTDVLILDKQQLTDIYNKVHETKITETKIEPKKPSPVKEGDKTTRLAERAATSLNKKYGVNLDEEDLAKYSTITNKDQIDRALAEFEKDYAKASQVLFGQEQPAEGILPTAYHIAAEQMAIKNKDIDMLQKLATQSNVSKQVSQAAQTVQLQRVAEKESPVKAVQEIAQIRTEQYDKTHKESAKETINKEKKTVKKTIEEQYNELDKEIDQFLKDLEC